MVSGWHFWASHVTCNFHCCCANSTWHCGKCLPLSLFAVSTCRSFHMLGSHCTWGEVMLMVPSGTVSLEGAATLASETMWAAAEWLCLSACFVCVLCVCACLLALGERSVLFEALFVLTEAKVKRVMVSLCISFSLSFSGWAVCISWRLGGDPSD